MTGANVASCALEEFSRDANGAASPINIINSPDQPVGMQFWGGSVRLDGAGNIFASLGIRNPSTGAVTFYIYGVAPTATGNAIPTVQITERTPLSEFGIN